jgi:hypothetical protein
VIKVNGNRKKMCKEKNLSILMLTAVAVDQGCQIALGTSYVLKREKDTKMAIKHTKWP